MTYRILAAFGLSMVLVSEAPALAAGGTVEVYLVAGQSNAQGAGDASLSPPVTAGAVLQFYGDKIAPGADPVGGASTGSAWPAFGNAYVAATNRKILFVPVTAGSTSQEAAADEGAGNWDTGSPLLADSMTEADVAIAALKKVGYTPVFKGVLWSQGERDGEAINQSTPNVTAANYEAALKRMIASYRAHFGSTMPFFLFKTGTQVGAPDPAFQAIRDAQEDVGQKDPYSFVVFHGAYDFWWRLLMKSDVHYSQSGYNQMGSEGAAGVAWFRSHPSSPKPPAAFPGTGTYAIVTNVTLTSAGAGWIAYTRDGSIPDCTKSAHYGTPLAIAALTPTVLQAVGCRAGIASPVAAFTYNYSVAFPNAPQASPAPGTYLMGIQATLSSSNASSIRWAWSDSGLQPSCGGTGTVYTGPIPLSPSHHAFTAVACNGAYAAPATFYYTVTRR